METLNLDLELVPSSASILSTQRIVQELSENILADVETSPEQDVGWRLAMAAHELLDNARKYGKSRRARFRFQIEATERGHFAVLRVQSRSDAKAIRDLLTIGDQLAHVQDPWAFYEAAMRRAATGTEGGVGLARIRAEGDMLLEVLADEDGTVSVGAYMTLRRAP